MKHSTIMSMAIKLIYVFLLASFTATVTGANGPSSFDLYFTTGSTSDYVIHRGLRVSNAVTVCFWARTLSTKTGTPFGYSSTANDNEFLIYNIKSLDLWVGGDSRPTSVSINDGLWHHVCATWSNIAGDWKIYKDGIVAAQGTGLRRGYTIPSNGALVLGQEQDNVGGGFNAAQSFEGQITQVNVWDSVLNSNQIRYGFSQYCFDQVGSGKVKSWHEFSAGIRGAVRIISPSMCGN